MFHAIVSVMKKSRKFRQSEKGRPNRACHEAQCRRLRCEPLEDRRLLSLSVLSTTPSLSGGKLDAGTTALAITFSWLANGAATLSNYQLQSPGADGLLGTVDDALIPLSKVSYGSTTATLSFPALAENLYRLTVRDAITDLSGNKLDGNGDGLPGGDWTRDFVATPTIAMAYALSTVLSGNAPAGVATGDFNADGIPDIAAANVDSIAILLGDGKGAFSAPTTFSSGGSYPYAVATGDFNGDGKLDLAAPNFNSGTVGVLLGDGTGHFSAATAYSCGGSWPEWVAVADFNGDGFLDLATANQKSNTIGLLLGNGNGAFQPVTTFDCGGSGPSALAVADFDGNGSPDLAVANGISNTVAVLKNLGGGSFALAGTYDPGGNAPDSLAAGDFNHDGKPDLVVLNNSTDNNSELGVVRLLLNDGSGGFTVGTTITLGDDLAQRVAIGDFNADGKLDAAVTYAFKAAILWGDGAGGLGSPTVLSSPVASPCGVAGVDLNGDGNLDLVIGSANGKTVGVLLADGKGGYAPPVQGDFATGGTSPWGVVSADFNRDGKVDLAVANQTGNTIGILTGKGDGTFALPSTCSPGGTWTQFLAAGDFSGDGNPDLAVTNRDQGTVGILAGDGHAGFSSILTYPTGLSHPGRVQAADLNADGNLDLVVLDATFNSTVVAILSGNGTGGFQAPQTFSTGGTNPWGVAIGDLNGDGKLDLVVADNGNSGSVNGTLGILLDDGAGGFSPVTTMDSGGAGLYGITAGDFNKDGTLDVALAFYNSRVGVLLGDGHGGFLTSSPVFYTSVPNAYSLIAGDLNGDGILDLATTSANNSVGILLGDGTGGFLPVVSYNVNGLTPCCVAAGDFNGDGRPDLAETNAGSGSVGILLNTTDPAPVTLKSSNGLPFDIAVSRFGAGQLVQGPNNAFDGDGRLLVGGQPFVPGVLGATLVDGGRSVVVGSGTAAGLTISRKITVPGTGGEDFARTVDAFNNPTNSPITTTVTIVANLGSDAATDVFATSNGNRTVEAADQWIGTDDVVDGAGTPAVIHYIHGPAGLQPSSAALVGDNITWTYNLTVPAGQTVRLAYFTILSSTRVTAIAAANALVTSDGFGAQAAAMLSPEELASLANFQFALPGDTNRDRKVDVVDLNKVLTDYNKSGMAWADGDFDGNGIVDVSDLNKVLTNYDKIFSASAPPHNTSGGAASTPSVPVSDVPSGKKANPTTLQSAHESSATLLSYAAACDHVLRSRTPGSSTDSLDWLNDLVSSPNAGSRKHNPLGAQDWTR